MSVDRMELFDTWADSYDRSVDRDQSADAYPFAGYNKVIEGVVVLAQIDPEHLVLDMGAGTGNLTAKLVDQASEVWGTDFSEKMLNKAREKVPGAHFARWDMQKTWPAELPPRFDRIVSTYALHHLSDKAKVGFLTGLITQRLRPGGCLVIGDVAFLDDNAQASCRRSAPNEWDETEHYFVASRIIPRLEGEGLVVRYKQISFCGGILFLQGKDAA